MGKLEQTTVRVAAHFSDGETEVLREGTEWAWDPGQSPLAPLATSESGGTGVGWDPLPACLACAGHRAKALGSESEKSSIFSFFARSTCSYEPDGPCVQVHGDP